MKEIWKKIKYKNCSHYEISNYGIILNTKTNRITTGFICQSGKYRMSFNDGEYVKYVHLIVLDHFKLKQINKNCGIHLDYDFKNNKERNLEFASRSEAVRYARDKNKLKKRGIHLYNTGKYKYWRSILSINQNPITLGYFETKAEAEMSYMSEYLNTFGYMPWVD